MTTPVTTTIHKPASQSLTTSQDALGFGKDTREELDFQFDEELESLPKAGRHHDFSEWQVITIIIIIITISIIIITVVLLL